MSEGWFMWLEKFERVDVRSSSERPRPGMGSCNPWVGSGPFRKFLRYDSEEVGRILTLSLKSHAFRMFGGPFRGTGSRNRSRKRYIRALLALWKISRNEGRKPRKS